MFELSLFLYKIEVSDNVACKELLLEKKTNNLSYELGYL